MAVIQADLSKKDKTSQQERGSAWIFKRALNDNVIYDSVEDILNDKKYPELVKLFPDVDESWLDSYWKENQAMHKKFQGAEFTEFTRDGGFMDYTSKLVKKKFGIDKKDTWDPADLWLTKNEAQITGLIDRKVVKDPTATIDKLNAMLRTFFRSRRVVGISLKLISGNVAKLVEVNTKGIEFKANSDEFNFTVTTMNCPLDVKPYGSGRNKGFVFATKESSIQADGKDHRQKVVYNYRVGGTSNLVIQPAIKGNKAQLGSAPVKMLDLLYKDRGLDFVNDHKAFPQTSEEFQNKKYLAKATKMFNGIKAKGVVTKVVSPKEFINNMISVYETSPKDAVLKLMQLNFFYEITKGSDSELNDIITEIAFMAQKRERGTYAWGFGPFGKLY